MRKFLILITCLIAGATPRPANAQLLPDDNVTSIKGRFTNAPDYQPLGARAGTFLIHPFLTTGAAYESNIFRTANNEESDFIYTVNPGVEVKSDWNLHSLQFLTSADFGLYQDNSDEDYEDYEAVLTGRYDITYNTYLYSQLSYERLHEDRGSPDDVRGDEPTEYDRYMARVAFNRSLGKLRLLLNQLTTKYEFENTSVSGTPVNNSVRDRTEKLYQARLGYEYFPNYEAYILGSYKDIDYDVANTVDRSSDGYDLRVGTAVDLSGKVKGDVYAGYLDREYSAPFQDLSEANYGASLIWNLNGITSIKAGLDRQVYETTSTSGPLYSGYLKTSGNVSVEHSFSYETLAEAYITYEQDEFIGGNTKREDDIAKVGLDFYYRPNRNIEFKAGYEFSERDSNIQNADYKNNTVLLSLSVKF